MVLLEAGPDLRDAPPAAIRDGWHITRELDWGYPSEPDARGVAESCISTIKNELVKRRTPTPGRAVI